MTKKEAKRVRTLGKILFILYIIFLVYFLFLSDWYGREGVMDEYHYNLVLFKEIKRFIQYRHQLGTFAVFSNLFGNILIFMPVGYFSAMAGKRRSSSSREFLNINNLEFHCQEDRMNSCDDIYRFHGKTATIYYQSGSSVGNLAYEIVVGNQTIYQFDKQLKSFQNTRKKQNHHLIWAFILFGLPSLYFYYLSKGVLSQVQVLTKEEEQELNRKENDYKLPTPSGKRIFTIILVIILMFFGLAINLQNQAFIILMILILGFILI